MPIASRFGGNSLRAFGQRGIVRVVEPTDPYFSYVSMLLSTTSLGNATNNLFVDSSGVFNPIDRIGTATPGSFSPYGSNWSNFFDGSGDYITLPSASGSLGTNDFTIECWYRSTTPTASTHCPIIAQYEANAQGSWALKASSGNDQCLQFAYYNSGWYDHTTTTNITSDMLWHHVAATRSGTTLRIYADGILVKTVAMGTVSLGGTGYTLQIGRIANDDAYMTGFISNVRIINGTALYTGSTYTVPTSPLTAVSGTQVLTCQSNRFIDNSTNNYAVTRNGDVRIEKASPFTTPSAIAYNQNDITNWSGYFDGTGDYLSLADNAALQMGSGDFTTEFWWYPVSISGYQSPLDKGYTGTGGLLLQTGNGDGLIIVYVSGSAVITAGTAVTAGAWNHIALVRSGTSLVLYLNGVSVGSATNSTNFNNASAVGIGANATGGGGGGAYPINGYMSNVRFVKGSAVYTGSFTPPTTNLTAIGGTSLLTLQSTTFTDNSTNNFIIIPNGDVTVSGNSPFNPTGYWSLSSSAINAGAVVPQTTATDLGSGSFTIECWVNRQSTGSIVTKRRTDTALTGSWALSTGASGYFTFLGVGWGPTHESTGFIPVGKWTHLAVTRSGTNLSMYVNGVRVYNATDNYNYTCSTYMIIKLWGNAGGNYPSGSTLTDGMPGSISNLRIVQGTSVYDPTQSTITVPTSPLTAVSGTSFLSLQNGTIKDNSPNNVSISLYNGGILQSADPFYTAAIASNSGSVYVDSTSYLVSASSPANNPRTGDFTLECWAYPFAFPNDSNLLIFQNPTNSYYVALEIRNAQVAGHTYFGSHADIQFTDLAPRLNAWNHLAISRINGTLYGYLNGVRSSTTSALTADFGAGNGIVYVKDSQDRYRGYISDARATIGSGVYPNSTYTVPTAPLTPTADTVFLLNSTSAGIYDAKGLNNLITNGDTKVSTSIKKYGTSSIYFDGTTDWMEHVNKTDWTWLHNGLQDWTIEWWMYAASTAAQGIVCTNTNSISGGVGMVMGIGFFDVAGCISGHFTRGVDGNRMDWRTAGNVFSTNTWTHVACMFNRTTKNMSVYINGTSVSVTNQNVEGNNPTGGDGSAFAYVTTAPSFNLNIGRVVGGVTTGLNYNGYIDDLRITRGVRRYTSNFTPPTRALPTR